MPKNYHYLALFFSFLINIATAQEDWRVNIPDPNFEQALIDLGIDSDGIINQSVLYTDIEYVYSLDISGKEISDLTGLSNFSGLRNLDCSSNLLTSLTIPLELQTLDCSSNMLTSLPSIPKELTDLNCSANLFQGLTFSSTFIIRLNVSQNPNLTTLEITNNNRIPNITYLNDGGLLSVTINQNPNLSSITCRGNEQLRDLTIENNQGLLNLEMKQLKSLGTLSLKENNDLNSLSLNSQMSVGYLDIDQNANLTSLYLEDVQIGAMALPESLTHFECIYGSFGDLDLSQKNINYLELSYGGIQTLDLRQSSIGYLYLEDVQLTNLDIGDAIIGSLDCYNTNLTSLDLSETNISSVIFRDVPLESLNFGINSSLSSVTCDNTNLTSLDLSNVPELKNLSVVNNNNIILLDIKNGNNNLLTNVQLTNNPLLECIFVDNATAGNKGVSPYNNWTKDDTAFYRTENCDYNVVLSTDKLELAENGETAIITATLNEVNANDDVTVNLSVSGSAALTNYFLSSNTIIIPAGEMSASVNVTALDDDMDSNKSLVLEVDSVENADALTEQKVSITIIHINNAPTNINLSSLLIDENSAVGTEIGFFTTTDIDSEDSFTYSLISGDGDEDNSSFSINDNLLISGEVFDFETKNTFSIRVLSDDGNGGVVSKSFTISVNDINFLVVENSIASLSFKNNIYIKLESSVIAKGFQFDIDLPDGFEFNSSEITNIGLPENFQISSENISGNTYRVLGFSLSNETIDSGTSLIIALPTFIDESTTIGKYPIPVYNVTLSDVDNQDIASLSPIDGIVTVYSNPRGDANGDNVVNVIDILSTIDYIFGNPPSVFNFDLVDINSDNTINVLDVLGIQDIILNRTGKSTSSKNGANVDKRLAGANYLVVNSKSFSAGTSETIEINLENEDVVRGLEFNFVLPEGFTLNPAEITGKTRLDGLTISASEVSANTYKVLVFAFPPSTSTIAAGSGVAFNVPVFIEPDMSSGVYPITFTSVVISDENLNDISTDPPSVGEITIINTLGIDNLENFENAIKIYPNPTTNILNIDSEVNCSYQIHDLNGRRVGKGNLLLGKNEVDISLLQSGLYLLKINGKKGAFMKKIMKK